MTIVKLRYNFGGHSHGAPWIVEDGPMVIHAAGYAISGLVLARMSKEDVDVLNGIKFTGLELHFKGVEVDVREVNGRPFVTINPAGPDLTPSYLH